MSKKLARVSISTGETPNDAAREGITNLGGISQFIGENETVFIKINLNMPTGFPSNVNLDTLREVIQLCKQAGAQKIYIGSFAFENFTVKKISDELGLSEFIEFNEGELAYLDNSDKIGTIKLSDEEKIQLQKDSFKEIEELTIQAEQRIEDIAKQGKEMEDKEASLADEISQFEIRKKELDKDRQRLEKDISKHEKQVELQQEKHAKELEKIGKLIN